jgi:hypothetical protein
MRRLKSKKEEAQKRKRNQIIIGVILVVVMFGSVFGLATMNFDNQENGNEIDYNGNEFVNQGTYWYLTMGGREFVFQYNPYQIEESFNLTTEGLKYLNSYSGAPLYVNSFDNVNAEGEIFRAFNGVALRIQRACLDNNGTVDENCPAELPLKDCSSNFIIIQEGEEEIIYQEDNCVFIQGSTENLIKLADDYLFRIMGIKSQI